MVTGLHTTIPHSGLRFEALALAHGLNTMQLLLTGLTPTPQTGFPTSVHASLLSFRLNPHLIVPTRFYRAESEYSEVSDIFNYETVFKI